MKLYYDSEKTKEIERKLYQKWHKEKHKRGTSTPFHVSDLIHCPMKFYNRNLGLERNVTKRNIGMMVFGIIGQKIIQMLYPRDECEYETKLEDLIYGHIDVYENKQFPLEIKATRKRVYKKINIPDQWIEQLMAYLTLEKKNKGWLIFLNVFTNQVSAFCLEMTKEELLSYNTLILWRASWLIKAKREKNPDLLTIFPEEYETCEYKHNCPRREECYQKFLELKKKDKKWKN